MEKYSSEELIDKYLAGNCNESEQAIVEGWMNQQVGEGTFNANAQALSLVEEEIWEALQAYHTAKVVPVPKSRKLWRIISGVAASIVMVAAISLYLNKTNAPQNNIGITKTVVSSPATRNNVVQLPDGSMVILGEGSKLSYSSSFEGQKKREVHLTGRAFFDIKHHPEAPFVVYAGKVTTTVLGTAFDVIAEPGKDEVLVRVVRGKVNVASAEGSLANLLPNKQISYDQQTRKAVLSDVNAKQEMLWTTRDMVLTDISFASICELMESRYGVNIKILDEGLKAKKFTISLDKHESLEHFLADICEFNNATYEIENDRVVIDLIK